MGWRGTLRSVGAAARRSQRESERRERDLQRSFAKIDRSAEQVLRKARTLESQIERDVIKALGLRYDEQTRLTCNPFEIHTDVFAGEIKLANTDNEADYRSEAFEPPKLTAGSLTIEPLALIVMR